MEGEGAAESQTLPTPALNKSGMSQYQIFATHGRRHIKIQDNIITVLQKLWKKKRD